MRQLELDLAHLNRLSIMGELTASLAHEILHPIATARNNARAAMRFLDMSPPNMAEVKDALACIVRDADRGKAIVNRIRDHIKKAPPRHDLFDLNEAIEEVTEMVRAPIEKNTVSVRTRLAPGLNSVGGDRVQLQQIVLNLVLNAVEAMGSVAEGARTLTIRTENDAAGILVVVHDIDRQIRKPFRVAVLGRVEGIKRAADAPDRCRSSCRAWGPFVGRCRSAARSGFSIHPARVTTRLMTSLRRPVRLERAAKTMLEMVVINRFSEVTNDPVLQSALADRLFRIGGQENRRNRVAASSRCRCSSTPVIPGIWTSATRQAVSARRGDARKLAADGKASVA